MRILITGASGMIGRNLINYLLQVEPESKIYAMKRPRTLPYLPDKVTYFDCDITDYHAVSQVIKQSKPEILYHLAAQSYPKISESNPFLTMDVNVKGTINLLEAIRDSVHVSPHKIINVCSAAGYGKVENYPTNEETVLKPLSLYGASKSTQDMIGFQYYMNYGLSIVNVRPYIILGKYQNENNAVNSFCKQIALIEKGKQDVLYVGNLESSRDLLDVKEIVKLLHSLSSVGENGESYNICSGVPRKMQDILNQLISLSTTEIKVVQDPSRLRPSDIELELGDNSKVKNVTGWKPTIPFEETLREILDYWRNQVV